MESISQELSGYSPFVLGAGASLAAGAMTGIGALPALFGSRFGEKTRDTLLGFAAGVMLAATAFSLVLPGVEIGSVIYGSQSTAAIVVAVGLFAGALGIAGIHRFLPHEHFEMGLEGADPGRLRRLWLFVIAITLHNFPEGLAVGVGFGGDSLGNGVALALGIGIQNLPEGLAVAVSLIAVGYRPVRAVWIALLTGLVEFVGGVLGAGVVSVAGPFLPFGLAFAGGAMLFVISHEIIPETHRQEVALHATAGLMVGFVIMMLLDVMLG